MSVITLRDSLKTQLDTQLGVLTGTPDADRLKIAQAFADAIDPHFSHGTSVAAAGTSGTVKTTVSVADPVVYLSSTVDTLLSGKSDTSHLHDSRYLQLSGGTLTGNLTFNSALRQSVNLYGTTHGMGVQTSTVYWRTDSNFGWYKGGIHSDASLSPGTGGTLLMSLHPTGVLYLLGGTIVPADKSYLFLWPAAGGNATAAGISFDNALALVRLGGGQGGVRTAVHHGAQADADAGNASRAGQLYVANDTGRLFFWTTAGRFYLTGTAI